MAVYLQDVKAYERSCVCQRRRLHAGKDQYQFYIFKQLSQIYQLAACMFPVAIYWFIRIPAECYQGMQTAWDAVDETWASRSSGSSVLCCEQLWLMDVLTLHVQVTATLRILADCPLALHRLSSSGAVPELCVALEQRGSDKDVCIWIVRVLRYVWTQLCMLFLLKWPQRRQDRALRLGDLRWTLFKKALCSF